MQLFVKEYSPLNMSACSRQALCQSHGAAHKLELESPRRQEVGNCCWRPDQVKFTARTLISHQSLITIHVTSLKSRARIYDP